MANTQKETTQQVEVKQIVKLEPVETIVRATEIQSSLNLSDSKMESFRLQLSLLSEEKDDDAAEIKEIMTTLSKCQKVNEGDRLYYKSPYTKGGKIIDGYFNSKGDEIKTIIRKCKRMLLVIVIRLKKKQVAIDETNRLAAIAAEEANLKAQQDIAIDEAIATVTNEKVEPAKQIIPEFVQPLARPKTKVTTVTRKVLEITDETLIPRDYMIIDRVKIEKALRLDISVPGAKLVDKMDVRV